jgi:hypothetical protein
LNPPGGACIFQHFGADVSRERPGDLAMAILPSDGDVVCGSLYRAGDQRGGRANQNIGKRRRRFHRGGNSRNLPKLLRQPMHFPVSCNQRPHVFLVPDIRQRNARSERRR